MGQHQPAISSIYQLIRKKSQSPSAENQLAPLLNQGNWHLIAILWDACEKNKEKLNTDLDSVSNNLVYRSKKLDNNRAHDWAKQKNKKK